MTTALKLGIGTTIGVGAIGGGVGITYAVGNNKPKILTIKEELEEESVQLLNTSIEEGNSDDNLWITLATEHAKAGEEITKNGKTIKKLNIPAQQEGPTKNQLIAKQLKIRCNNLLAKKKESADYEQSKRDIKNWCSKFSPLLIP